MNDELDNVKGRLLVVEQRLLDITSNDMTADTLMRLYSALRAIELGVAEPAKVATAALKACYPSHYRDPNDSTYPFYGGRR